MNDGIYLSQKEILLAIVEKGQSSRRYKLGEIWELNFEEIREALDDVPAADVRPVVRGKWIPSINQDLPGYLMCSACKEAFFNPSAQPHIREFNYCFNCGADMRGEGGGEDG